MLKDPYALVIPDGTEVIRNSQYEETDYERVFIPKSVSQIENYAFDGCKNLKEVVIEEGSKLKIIGKDSFRNCNSLTKMTFPEGLEKIGFYSFWETGLETIEFPVSLRTIAQGAFNGCKSLKAVKFNEGLEVLGTNEYPENKGKRWFGVFEKSTLEKVELPSILRRIEYNAF